MPSFSGTSWLKSDFPAGKGFFPPAVLCLLALLLSLGLQGCTQEKRHSSAGNEIPEIIQDGIKIPRFSTAAGQLNYAASVFEDKKRKSAALRAVAALFPENRLECGHAALGLAYLHLEPDYRFAKPIDILKAANDFKAVLKAYPDMDDVVAKTHWYLGWIHTTLCHPALDGQTGSTETGRRHFRAIVRDFSSVPMNLSPPEPWVNLARPEEFPTIKQSAPVKYWAQVALLELVRHPGSEEEALKAVDMLYDRFFSSMETGFALKHMLTRPGPGVSLVEKASAWAARNTANPYLSREISALALEAVQ
ncbi:MAG: hypothetical protein HUN04_26420 [Desulfobacter sp.]|nr:MAG: hypothetical protein HUN04_26420 [Desulfobacter sp.]